MSDRITDYSTIPAAPFYVFAADNLFASDAEFVNKSEILVFPCDSSEQAQVVKANALARGDLESEDFINIRTHPPTPSDHVIHTLMSREDAARWYEPGGFTYEEPATFNGFANRATFHAVLVIENDKNSYDTAARLTATDPEGNDLKAWALQQSRIAGTPLDTEFANNRGGLEKVNWKEVAANFEDVVSENPKLLALRSRGLQAPRPPQPPNLSL